MPEVFDVVDEADRIVGRASRAEVHGNPTLIHRVAHILVFNRQGELYLQKRSMDKDVQPGKWDTSVGGHVDVGESLLDAAVRELGEELGIMNTPIEYLWKYLHQNTYESEYVCTYKAEYNGEIAFDPVEIADGRFWKIIEVRDNIGTEIFTPNFEDESGNFSPIKVKLEHVDMKILLTGGTGNVGRAAAAHLTSQGYELTVIGRRPESELETSIPKGASYAQCDITDLNSIRIHMKGCDAVVHLAATPSPFRHPSHEVFSVNAVGTFNIFESAAREGILKVVQASSINAIGYNFGCKDIDFSYFPLDEKHPSFTTDAYSFSKEVIEDIGRYYFRRDGINSVALRIPGVYQGSEGMLDNMIDGLKEARVWLEELLARPIAERKIHAQKIIRNYNKLRGERALEFPESVKRISNADKTKRPVESWVTGGMANFFTLVDDRDSALAIEKSLEADFAGSFPIFVNDRVNWCYLPSWDLAQVFYPSVEESEIHVTGTESLVNVGAAKELIGWTPAYSLEERWQAIL